MIDDGTCVFFADRVCTTDTSYFMWSLKVGYASESRLFYKPYHSHQPMHVSTPGAHTIGDR